jgi:glycine dehydrogenase subunit 1
MPFIGNTDDDRRRMLDTLGLGATSELFADVPEDLRYPDLELPEPFAELEALRETERLAGRNAAAGGRLSFLGGGAYGHFVPSVVDYLASRGEFATSYTPYQAEASQGTLQSIFEYQSMAAALLDIDVVNASQYDGATAFAEAAAMALRATGSGRRRLVMGGRINPQYLEVLGGYLQAADVEIVAADGPDADGAAARAADLVDESTAAVLIQSPDFLGRIHDLRGIAERVHEAGALLVVHTDPIAAALFRPPGADGADIVTAEGQPLGIPLSYGGPYLGMFGCRRRLVRKMPGRVVGETVDAEGNRGFVLTLSTREQHIRREKATSNICTNQGLMALRAAIYMAAMGPSGMRTVARLCYDNAREAARRIDALPGFTVEPGLFFKEFAVQTPVPAAEIVAAGNEVGISPGLDLGRFYPDAGERLLIAVTEQHTDDDIARLIGLLKRWTR